MKGRTVAFVGVLCIAVLIVSGAYAEKPRKPDKPSGTATECIAFEGPDLAGARNGKGLPFFLLIVPLPKRKRISVQDDGWPRILRRRAARGHQDRESQVVALLQQGMVVRSQLMTDGDEAVCRLCNRDLDNLE